jgi:hypothetical protein
MSPVIGSIIYLLLTPTEDYYLKKGIWKKCRRCYEIMDSRALVCVFCGEEYKENASVEKPYKL